jgi:hypothetical protein
VVMHSFTAQTESIVLLEDIRVASTSLSVPIRYLYASVAVAEGSSLEIHRAVFEDNPGTSLAALEATLRASDLLVRDGVSLLDDRGLESGGVGLACFASTVEVERARFERMSQVAIFVSSGVRARFSDIAIADVSPWNGTGAAFLIGSDDSLRPALVELARAYVRGAFGVGVSVSGAATLRASDLEILGTQMAPCDAAECVETRGGSNLNAHNALIEVSRFRVADAALAGIHLSGNPEFFLSDGWVIGNEFGLAVGDPNIDIASIPSSVRFEANTQSLISAARYVPVPPERIELTEVE